MQRLAPAFLLMIAPAFHGAAAAQEPDADFLFGKPRGSLTARGGWQMASASSDIYDFFGEELTIEKSDFDSFVFGADGSFAIASRVDLVAGFEITKASVDSEYRDFVDENDLPILQETGLMIVPVTLSAKLYLTPRGREVSRYAYVPSKVRAYVGGGRRLRLVRARAGGRLRRFRRPRRSLPPASIPPAGAPSPRRSAGSR